MNLNSEGERKACFAIIALALACTLAGFGLGWIAFGLVRAIAL